jgi:hypothetical protein
VKHAGGPVLWQVDDDLRSLRLSTYAKKATKTVHEKLPAFIVTSTNYRWTYLSIFFDAYAMLLQQALREDPRILSPLTLKHPLCKPQGKIFA